jgi:hypothetical protein
MFARMCASEHLANPNFVRRPRLTGRKRKTKATALREKRKTTATLGGKPYRPRTRSPRYGSGDLRREHGAGEPRHCDEGKGRRAQGQARPDRSQDCSLERKIKVPHNRVSQANQKAEKGDPGLGALNRRERASASNESSRAIGDGDEDEVKEEIST